MIVRLNKKEYSYSFARWLKRRIQFEILSSYYSYYTSNIQEYIRTEYGIEDSVYSLVKKCLSFLQIVVTKDSYVISIDNSREYKGIRIITLANLIDYGVIGVRGIHIFSNVFNNVSANTARYYHMFNPNYIVEQESSYVNKTI